MALPLRDLTIKDFPADYAALGFNKIEIVGFDHVSGVNDSVATWIIFKRTKSSGIIIQCSFHRLCSSEGMGDENVKKITLNMINKLLKKGNVFSNEVSVQNHRIQP